MGASRSSRSATGRAGPSSRGRAAVASRQGPVVTLDPEQRSRLLAVKLTALVDELHAREAGRSVARRDGLEQDAFPGGVAMRGRGVGWVLVAEAPEVALGRALVWARRHGIEELHVLVDEPAAAGVLARRATTFAPPPKVWVVDGRTVRAARPAPSPAPLEPPAVARGLVALLAEAGTEVVTEHGEIRGEVLGLEVARVVVDDSTESVEPQARIEVGVGRHDRDAFAMLHGDLPTDQALAGVVDKVRRHRQHDAEAHPLGRLAAERWLRVRVLEHPSTVGAAQLTPADPTLVRDGVKDVAPAIALGHDDDGTPVVVACSVGIDLDLVPAAADARLAHAPGGRLVLVLPERDDHRVTRDLVDALAVAADVVVVPTDWRRTGLGPTGSSAATGP